MSESDTSRRRFLEVATMAIGGAIGAVLAFPLMRYLLFPVRRTVVADPAEPLDVMDANALQPGAPPVRVKLTASGVRNAWSVADDVALGAAWIRKTPAGTIQALSSTCPHLGCAVAFDAQDNMYKCPCHKSAFDIDGNKLAGPSKRGLDPLPVKLEGGRVKVAFVRYRPDVPRSQAGGPVIEPTPTGDEPGENGS